MDTADRGDIPQGDAASGPRRSRLPALRSIGVQLPLAMLLIAGVLLASSLWLAIDRATNAARLARESVLREHAGAVGRLLAEYLRQGTVDQVRVALGEFAGAIALSDAVVIDPDDRVMASTRDAWSGWTWERTAFGRARPLIERARREGREIDGDLPLDAFVVVVPLVAPGTDPRAPTPRAWLLLAEFDLHPLLTSVRREIVRFYLLSALFSLVGLLLMGMFLQHRVTRPASRLAAAAERIAAGDRSARVGLTGEDELGRAAQAFDVMAARIEEAEAAVRRHQVMLDGLLRALPVGVMAVSRDERRVLFTNSRWRDLFDLDVPTGDAHAHVLADMRFYRRDGSPLPAAELAIPQALATGQPVGPIEVVAEPTPGTRIPLVVRAEPVRFGDGPGFDAVVAVMQDRRDFERLFEELRRSERRFESLLESLPVGALMVDRATRTVLYANRRLRELCGVDSPAGRPIERLGGRRETADGRPFPIERLPVERVLEEGRAVEVDDLVFVHDDGERVPVVALARPMNLGDGPEFDAVAALVQDRRDLERAFRDLRRSEARFAALLDAMPVGVFMVDRATRTVLYANRRLEELGGHPAPLGCPIHLLEGRKETDDGRPYPQERLPVERVLEEHQAIQVDDLVYVRPDGTRVQAVTQALPVSLSGEPGFDAVILVVQDRRDFERAVTELRHTQDRFAALLDALPVGVFMVDRATRTVLYANHKLEELGGHPVPRGRPIHELEGRRETDAGEAYPLERLPIERVLADGQPVEADDLVYVRPDGTRVQVVTTALPLRTAGGPGFDAVLAVVQDRRDLEHAFAELKESEERFQNVSRATGQAVYEWDYAADHCRFSDSITSVFGYAAAEVDSNEKWNAITHPDDLPGVQAEMQASVRERRMFDAVYRVRHRDGRWRWVRDRGLPRFDDEGRPVLLTGAIADITEQRELEARFRQSQKMETVGTLAGGIAHDFNNQLTGVLGHLDLLRDELPPADARQDHVRIARVAAERCAELTRGLLAFSRMLRGEPRPVDVNATIEETAALLRRVLPSTIQLELRAGVDLPPALVDPSQLQQVLLNLCVNARDAMPEGGRLRLSTSRSSVGPEAAAAAGVTAGEYVVIEVADDGAGISPDVLPRIFEPFYTTKPVGVGTGLGLSMVYGIVSQHHGWVAVDSAPGRGASFRVHLPVAVEGVGPEPAAEPVEAARTAYASRLVLVVDDEPIVREFAVRLLERAGCTVLQAGDGTEAVARLGEHALAVEAVLLDLTMPGRPVREVVRTLRRIAPGVRIVLTSGYSEEVASVPEFAGLTFLPKPFTPGQLLGAMCAPAGPGPLPGEA